MKRPVPQALTAAVLLVLLAPAGCASSFDRPANTLPCASTKGGVDKAMILMAQAVPTASALPCVRSVSNDWSLDDIKAKSGQARITLGYLQNMPAVTVELTRHCDLAGAKETSSDQPGMRRYDKPVRHGSGYADQRYYVYAGGCTSYRFDLHGAGAEAQAAEISRALGFVTRQKLRQQVREYSGNRLQLDPGGTS